jgi:hypothetical protein
VYGPAVKDWQKRQFTKMGMTKLSNGDENLMESDGMNLKNSRDP